MKNAKYNVYYQHHWVALSCECCTDTAHELVIEEFNPETYLYDSRVFETDNAPYFGSVESLVEYVKSLGYTDFVIDPDTEI